MGLALLLGLTWADAREISFYISPQGNDAWSGRRPDARPGSGDGPFATLPAALSAASAELTQNRELAVNILLRGGNYELAAPIVLKPEHSGSSATRPVTVAAYRNEKPVLSAGRRITGWQKAATGNLWFADLPEVRAGKWYFRQLWVNGGRRQRARHPNTGYFKIAALPDSTVSWEKGHHRFQFQSDDLQAWPSATQGEVVAMTRWVESRLPITNIDAGRKFLESSKKSVFQLQPGDTYYVEGVLETLDQPGEWYLNAAQGRLYYLPLPGEKLEDFVAVAPRFAECLRLEGNPAEGRFVQHLRFRGLTFAHTEWFFPKDFGSGVSVVSTTPDPEILGFAQAAYGVPGAVMAEGVRECRFERCRFTNLGGYGLQLGRGCRNNTVSHCELSDLGAGGIKIGETQIRTHPGELTGDNVVSDCRIRDGGKMFASGEGVWIGQSFGNHLAHNAIEDFFYTAVSIGWTWGYGTALASNNIVEFNHLHHIGQKASGDGPILSDMGGIYTLGLQPGTILRHNLIHDVKSHSYGGWGLYTDEGSSGILLENNVVYHCKNAGFHQHYGRENIVRNNIFAFNTEHQLMRSRAEPHVSFVFTNNIVVFDTGVLLGSLWDDGKFVMDRNLYFDARPAKDANPPHFGKLTFAEWQRAGHDQHSLVADPAFVAPARGDFRLSRNSPARKLGIKSIDARSVGPRD